MSLEYKIGADVRGFQAGVTQVTQSMNKLDQVSAKTLASIGNNAKGGALALNSLSQVARDLPFGFIAIQNNLPIVFDQFAQLTKQSGGLVAGLKSVGAALVGPAGISFLAGAAIAGVTALVQKYGSLSAALTELASSSDLAATRQRSLNGTIVEAEANTAGEIAKLNSLIGVLNNGNNSQLQRINAYKDLKKEFPGVIQNLSQENALTKQGAEITNLRAQQLIEYIKLKGREAALTKLIADATEKELKSGKAAVDLINNQNTLFNKFISTITGGGDISRGFAFRIGQINEEFEKGKSDVDFYSKSLNGLQEQIQKFDRDLSQFKDPKTPVAKAAQTTGNKVRVAAPLVKIVPERVTLDQNAVNDALVNRGFNRETGIVVPVSVQIPQSTVDALRAFGEAAQLQTLEEKTNAITASFNDFLAPAINTAFQALANGQNVGQALAQSFKALGVQLGLTIVKALALAAILQATGIGAVIGGSKVTGFGNIFKSLLGGALPKFAEGGIVTRPTAGIFGEKGPEAIMPLDKLNAMISNIGGGGNTQISGEFILSGDNLYATVQRAAQRRGRIG